METQRAPIKDVTLQRCFITEEELEELKGITQVGWDGMRLERIEDEEINYICTDMFF